MYYILVINVSASVKPYSRVGVLGAGGSRVDALFLFFNRGHVWKGSRVNALFLFLNRGYVGKGPEFMRFF